MTINLRENYPVYMLSLGCSKNLVDAEFLSGSLDNAGYPLVKEPKDARIIIVNTCGFIQSAKEEAIDAVLEMADYRADHCELLVMAGCLAERYSDEIVKSLPELDLVVGVKSYYEVLHALDAALFEAESKKVYKSSEAKDALKHLRGKRNPSTDVYAYLKIAEGCYHSCAYCAIPLIRGKHISRPMEDLIDEAKSLVAGGFQELVMVAQDLSAYGLDLYGERKLNDLLRELLAIPGLRRLRTLYLYCDAINDEFIELMANHPNFMPYIDLPIQHASSRILKRMRRRETQEMLRATFQRLRDAIPNVALRTTVMLGFPGETEEDFMELLNFIEEIRFDHLGCFVFSPEEGTLAATFEDQIDRDVAEDRYHQVMELQRRISEEKLSALVGQQVEVLLEAVSDDGLYYIGRTERQAPEVDGYVNVLAPNYPLEMGQRVLVELLEAESYDFIGQEITVLE